MSVTFLRHAVLSEKNQNRYNGWRNLPIDERLFDHSKVKALKEESFDLIYSSDLIRCTRTLELLFDNNYPTKQLYTTKALREVKFKDEIEGKNFEEIAKLSSFKSAYLKNKSSWHNYICQEKEEAFHSRLETFLKMLPKQKNILICSHAGAIQEMLKILKQPLPKLNYLDYYKL